MIIEVTQKHIDNGRRGNCFCCMVALAATDAGLIIPTAHVDGVLTSNPDGHQFAYQIPPHVVELMHVHDRGGRVEPFRFEAGEPVQWR